jgi:NifU-like protein
MTVAETIDRAALSQEDLIRQAIESLRPYLRADGGDCELVDIEGDVVRVRMKGACIACQFASATIGGVQERLIAAIGRPLRVIPVPPGR